MDRSDYKPGFFVALCAILSALLARGQTYPEGLGGLLNEEILAPAVADFEMRQYLLKRVAPPPSVPATSQEWTAQAAHLRRHLLNDIVFHGWPNEWVNAAPKFEDAGVIETGSGYHIRKLRYEIVPGFYSVALLYEPEHIGGRTPAIVNLNGHGGGKASESTQKMCINYAKHGVMALNLEWLSCGELQTTGNEHSFGAHLDLVGSNALGIFYLEMRKGLDYLYDHPNVDRDRIGVTGLSGGGWQTIVLSSLDERVRNGNPVAGFSSLCSRLEAQHTGDMGDIEQVGTDFLAGQDYSHLVALVAPRPMLLTYNAEDDCCFRAGLVKPLVYDAIQPFYTFYGAGNGLQWYENRDPGTHNFQLDNRLANYRFFSKHFGLPQIDNEDAVAPEIKSADELAVGLPRDNLTILDLARRLGGAVSRPPLPADTSAKADWSNLRRVKLKEIVRYKPVDIAELWTVAATKSKDVESLSYLFQMNNRLSASGVWIRSIGQSSNRAPVTIVLNDKGKEAAAEAVSERVNRGEQVLALNLLFTQTYLKGTTPDQFAQTLDTVGERPLGMEAAQLSRIAVWAIQRAGASRVRIETDGARTQMIALVAAALDPSLFSVIVVRDGMHSLSYLLELPVSLDQAPDLFCLDLYREFDVDSLEALAAPVKVSVSQYVEVPKK